MTALSPKDQLLTKLHEWDAARQKASRACSEMHGIIAALPDREVPIEIGTSLAGCVSMSSVACPQNDRCCEEQLTHSLPEKHRRNRPVVVAPSQADSKPVSKPAAVISTSTSESKPKKPRAKRAQESDIRKAVKLVYDENIPQKEAEKACNLPQGTLSRRKGKEIMTQYRKDWGTPTKIDSQHGVSRKELEKALRYGDDR
jgi:hypothetical protein